MGGEGGGVVANREPGSYIYIYIECNLGERSGVAHVEIGALWVGEKNPGDPEGRGEGEGEEGSCKKHRCKQVRSHFQLSEQDHQNYGHGRRQGRVDHNAFCQSYFLLGNVTIKCL